MCGSSQGCLDSAGDQLTAPLPGHIGLIKYFNACLEWAKQRRTAKIV